MKLSKMMMNMTVATMVALISMNASAYDQKAARNGEGGAKCSGNVSNNSTSNRHDFTKQSAEKSSKQKEDRDATAAGGRN